VREGHFAPRRDSCSARLPGRLSFRSVGPGSSRMARTAKGSEGLTGMHGAR